MVALFKLIRWPNLLMIAFIQYLIRFSFTEAMNLPHALDHFYYGIGVLCSVLLAAGGYIINDLYDLPVDKVNKPQRISIGKGISEDNAWYLYFGTIILASICAYVLAIEADMENLWMIAPLAASILYLYAFDLKKRPLIGNVLVSALTAMPVFLVAVFDFLPAGTEENAAIVQESFRVIIYYALLAFWLNLIREILKDLEDREGDRQAGYKTLALILPTVASKIVLLLLLSAGLYPIIEYGYRLFSGSSDKSSGAYVFLAVVLPLLVLGFQIVRATTAKQFKRASTLSKIIMLLGILSMPFFTLALYYGWP